MPYMLPNLLPNITWSGGGNSRAFFVCSAFGDNWNYPAPFMLVFGRGTGTCHGWASTVQPN
jgi:hypothetical protein